MRDRRSQNKLRFESSQDLLWGLLRTILGASKNEGSETFKSRAEETLTAEQLTCICQCRHMSINLVNRLKESRLAQTNVVSNLAADIALEDTRVSGAGELFGFFLLVVLLDQAGGSDLGGAYAPQRSDAGATARLASGEVAATVPSTATDTCAPKPQPQLGKMGFKHG